MVTIHGKKPALIKDWFLIHFFQKNSPSQFTWLGVCHKLHSSLDNLLLIREQPPKKKLHSALISPTYPNQTRVYCKYGKRSQKQEQKRANQLDELVLSWKHLKESMRILKENHSQGHKHRSDVFSYPVPSWESEQSIGLACLSPRHRGSCFNLIRKARPPYLFQVRFSIFYLSKILCLYVLQIFRLLRGSSMCVQYHRNTCNTRMINSQV